MTHMRHGEDEPECIRTSEKSLTFELDVIVMSDVHQILSDFGIHGVLSSTRIDVRNFYRLPRVVDDATVVEPPRRRRRRRRRGEATVDDDDDWGGGRRTRTIRCQSSEGRRRLRSPDDYLAHRGQGAAEDRCHRELFSFTALSGVYRKAFSCP